jgi:hypothetical protein
VTKRWVRLWIPARKWERETWGEAVVIGEAPKGVGREVRLATEQETGMFGRLALPAPRAQAGSTLPEEGRGNG